MSSNLFDLQELCHYFIETDVFIVSLLLRAKYEVKSYEALRDQHFCYLYVPAVLWKSDFSFFSYFCFRFFQFILADVLSKRLAVFYLFYRTKNAVSIHSFFITIIKHIFLTFELILYKEYQRECSNN